MEFLLVIILGIIQGITEWLPISSTAHLILFEQMWSMGNESFFEVFKVVIQFGSILAVLVLYYKKLNPWYKTKSISEKKETWHLWSKVFVASLPLIVAFFLDDLVLLLVALIFLDVLFLLVEELTFFLLILLFSLLSLLIKLTSLLNVILYHI